MKSIFHLTLLLITISGFSQNKISGIVTDVNQQKLSGVIVHVEENNLETTTDENGYYQFLNFPKGTNKVIFHLSGYETKTETITNNGTEITLNIILTEKELHLEEVIISTLYNKIQSQNVMKVEHANMKELQQKGNTTLIEGLATIPGVSQVSTGTSI